PVPPYPYGPRLLYKQSNNGLYGSARIRHGHNVSEKHHQVSNRTWRPNVHYKRLWSEALGVRVRIRLTTRVLRTVEREGGIDAYVTKTKPARIKDLGPGGWRLRWLVMNSSSFREKYAKERVAIGVSGEMPEDQTDLVHYMIDAATPGPLSAASRRTIARRTRQMMAEEFVLGEDAEELEAGAQRGETRAQQGERPRAQRGEKPRVQRGERSRAQWGERPRAQRGERPRAQRGEKSHGKPQDGGR
ncbi:54S ribosomal protein L24, mitochondrial, partial [Colletotrichum tanaceti]